MTSRTLLIAALLFGACAGTETGNPAKQSQRVTLSYAPLTATFMVGASQGYVLQAATVGLQQLAFQTCDGQDAPVIDAARTIDLVRPGIEMFDLADSSHCTLSLSVSHVLLTLTTPKGTGMSQATASSQSPVDVDIELHVKMPSDLPRLHNHLILTFDMAGWVDPLGFEASTAGKIMLGHPVDRSKLEDAIRNGILLFDDHNNDGKLDAPEQAAGSLVELTGATAQ